MPLKDIQSQNDHRRIEIDKVGVKGIHYPIVVLDKMNKVQNTVATINMYVSLPHHFKGTHMSRFIEVLNAYRHGISTKNISEILIEIKEKLRSESAHIEIFFPFFIEKQAPVTGAASLMEYTCHLVGCTARSSIWLSAWKFRSQPCAPAHRKSAITAPTISAALCAFRGASKNFSGLRI